MNQFVEVVLAGLSVSALAAMSAYVVLALHGSSAAFYATIAPRSWPMKVFVVLVAIALSMIIFGGAMTLLWWLPSSWGSVDEDGGYTTARVTLAGLVTFLGTPAVGYVLASATEAIYERRILSERSRGLAEILRALTRSADLQRLRLEFEARATSLDAHVQRRGDSWVDSDTTVRTPKESRQRMLRDLVELVERVESDVKDIASAALLQEQHRRESKANRLRELISAEDKAITAVADLNRYRDALAAAAGQIRRRSDGTASGTWPEPQLLERALVDRKWAELDNHATGLFALSESDIRSGKKGPFSLEPFFAFCAHVALEPGSELTASYSGDAHGGHTELSARRAGQERSYLSALKVGTCHEALIEALYVGCELPTLGAYWHGLAGRDHKFLFEERQIIQVLQASGVSYDSAELRKIDRPCGVRVRHCAGSWEVCCLAAYPNGEIVDLAVKIDDGRITVLPAETLLPPGGAVYY